MIDITNSNIISKQIYWLRLLSTLSADEIMVMLKPESKWISLSDIIDNPPERPIHSRTILKNEIVLEIDNDDWIEVRDGTKRIIDVLNQWGAAGHYYLSFSGNRSIHVHVFMDHSLNIHDDTKSLIQGRDDVNSVFKSYFTLQIARASHTVVDMGLSSKHLIRMEGGFNEKSKKYCTEIYEIPDEKPLYYDIVIPSKLPNSLWDISSFENEINHFLKIHYTHKPGTTYHFSGKPIDPEPLKEILKPVFIDGYRHFIISALSGWLRRHAVTLDKTLEVVMSLNFPDKTPSKTKSTVKEIYSAKVDDKIPGLPSLLNKIREEVVDGVLDDKVAGDVIAKITLLRRSKDVN